ncbi:cysteine desulfurase [uncultured Methanospirillum sp.]|uniref:aminotransferase class V-fold PLP-dependent enzyme n=1 Tax=uncultured Methanospirillum sp. TaxID=262503 RepID=UPI0029C7CBBD|nr:cysteine desulfurase [uncultured Methanospirillum sp.]
MYDLTALREEFPVLEEVIYLDNAATTQTPVRSVEAICDFFYEYAGNYGRGTHRLARETTARCEESREDLAGFLGAYPEQIIWTGNTTGAINLISQGLPWKKGDEVLCTALEHHSNFLPWMALKRQGVKVSIVPQQDGYVDPDAVSDMITGKTRVVAVTQMTNVTGTIQPVDEIADIAHDKGALIVVDGAQSVGHIPVDISKMDYLAIAGHKGLLGPQGVGALYAEEPATLSESRFGGGTVTAVSLDEVKLRPAPARFEPGTPNIPGIIGMGPAIRLVDALGVDEIADHEEALGIALFDALEDLGQVDVYSPRGTTVISFGVDGIHPDLLATRLDDMADICVRSGMHCAEPYVRSFCDQGTVRASVACYTTREEVITLADALRELLDSWDPDSEPEFVPEPDPWEKSRCP